MDSLEVRIEKFIENAKKVNNNRNYDYSLVASHYKTNRDKVPIVDCDLDSNGKEYGVFWISPSNLLKGKGHPSRRGERIKEKVRFTQEEWIEKAKKVHSTENLDYSQVVYKTAHDKVYIIDNDINPKTGEPYGGYWQEANSHLRGHVHPLKAINKTSADKMLTQEEFLEKARRIHEDKGYDYSLAEYGGFRKKIKVVCPKHGVFETMPDNFLAGKGCPICGYTVSKAEDEIYRILAEDLGEENVCKRSRGILSGQHEIDLYIPSKNLGIEYNGLRWHSEAFGKGKYYHYNKMKECHEKGITLFQIFEDEYNLHKSVVLDKIKHALGLNESKPSAMARKCIVKDVPEKVAKEFLEMYHIQGYARATKHYACYMDDIVVGVMSFKKETKDGNEWSLTRFATNYNYKCQGVGSKIFSYFLTDQNPSEVKTFLDRRWEVIGKESLYDRMGFKLESYEKPDYMYTNGHGVRLHKFGFRKQILNKKYNLPLSMTENEMTKELGYWKIWNCGLAKYIWKKEK